MNIIVAIDIKNGIGKNGKIPWNYPLDLQHFRKLTLHNTVLMGRKTWDSLPLTVKPLPWRLNIVLTRNKKLKFPKQVLVIHDFKLIPWNKIKGKLFIIGGQDIYKHTLKQCNRIYCTKIYNDYNCDRFFPEFLNDFELEKTINSEKNLDFFVFKRKHSSLEEYKYLNLVNRIFRTGKVKSDRTGTGTLSIFGEKLEFSLENNTIPLLTTKRIFWRGIVEELLWFISGNTNSNTLRDRNVHIWDANGSTEFLKKRGLNYSQGDLGPVYGFQWRHFGAQYKTCNDNYNNQGIDQLSNVIETIKTNPTSRRIILSAWNPCDLDKMALPPCHILVQFNVVDKKLNCQMYQRSADVGLGVPFNIASYSLLTHIIAHCTGLKPGKFIHVMGDTHIYLNHIKGLREQLQRNPQQFPKLYITTDNKDINKFSFTDFKLVDYNPQPRIKLEMAV